MLHNTLTSERYVYIVFSATNLLMGRIIRFLTRNCYNHVSLALSCDLKVMYSFARYNINSPLVGGFVIEHPSRFSIKNREVDIKVYRVPVSETGYQMIEKTVQGFSQRKNEMIYNTFNAVLSLFHKKIKIQNAYTCVEFIAAILGLKDVISLKSLQTRLKSYTYYTGKLKNISTNSQPKDDYFTEKNPVNIFLDMIGHFKVLMSRAIELKNPFHPVNPGNIK
jgi:hypothetical protein